jgi:opine dehydrogenase
MMRVAVVGAGHGGLGVAGQLALHGHEVAIMDVDPTVVEPVARIGGVTLTGAVEGAGKIALATAVMADAVRGADLVMVVVPGDAHGAVAAALAPHVTAGQMVVLHPGGTGGAFEIAAAFRRLGVTTRPVIAEIESFTIGSKTVAPTTSRIGTAKKRNGLAALPASDTAAVLDRLRDDFPQLVAAPTVLQTSLNHMNAMLHVATMLMNAGWIETAKGGFEFYRDGVSPAVAHVIEAVDRERMAVSDALGARAITLRAWIQETYGVAEPTLYETIQTLHARVYKTSPAPGSLASRYLTEDVPTGLVPIAALGAACGVATPTMNVLLDLASTVHGVDHRTAGRSLARMGLEGKDANAIRRVAERGFDA